MYAMTQREANTVTYKGNTVAYIYDKMLGNKAAAGRAGEENAELKAEVERLRRLFLKYGWHQADCRRGAYRTGGLCDCGWSEAFDAENGKE